MRDRRKLAVGLFAAVAMLVAAACGQKPDVYKLGAPAGAAGEAAVGVDGAVDEAGNPISGSASALGSGSGSGPGSSSTTTTGGGDDGPGGGDDDDGEGPPPVAPGEPT